MERSGIRVRGLGTAFGVLGLVLGIALLSPPAVAVERDATASESRAVVEKLQGLGYRSITDVDVVGQRFVVDAISPQGRDVDVILDRRTLRVITVRGS